MMETLSPNLSLNINQLLQKKAQINDLQYDQYCKYLAIACKSQTGPEIVILEKEGMTSDSQNLKPISSFTTRCEVVMLYWCPATFGQILAAVLCDNTLVFYKCQPNQGWSPIYEKPDLAKSISCLAVGTSPAGVLLGAVGSPDGRVSVLFSTGNYETVNFMAHHGGIYSLSFKNADGMSSDSGDSSMECLLATGGIDKSLKLWQLVDRNFQLVQALPLTTKSKAIVCIKSIAWSKDGLKIAAATCTQVFVFEKNVEWVLLDTIEIGKFFEKIAIAFANDRIVISHDSGTLVYARKDSSPFKQVACMEE
ncbi:bifunctional WD40 repeat/Sec13-Seh1 family/WD40-YVTN repeat-like-containing domain superfamily/Protein Sec13/WD40-repeat-containing domain superfamily [Babesia duncani]|uniref:Bifunctional WD40 repeat/Sec13-Seh1 family/WD40-YVTN repeat-like-containing domain superfamily/Protein Sec13/WD40-repeat-containing domain superfamily n=1 Tax=Babesia duncani TaxID=323732 RepID=A0AAD9UM15_9APIC|nr:bifunctional WD40 repeat/Sec13-Seh1 family/WD40-YVTN repeat-like-containing domain superfamily/Protein Sec13/WD40-repeat-containing domain superfamily [Babesia duncani]KAK2194703.1 bifunctional WD40 repeat/Sec13-Seh1 family/WD40-YVTN repeat-like-containing domain superfamily/Protein Sec13/WD40-repeat-containing domain superfamily [Babesia duncani]KAK2197986.1 bifunctional WD40 repeat/Sec13-Seh1 family/WD40-YVTN repeat-like-containing domain superfamily/Protein Sec13/WD40-repeat-containing doma